MREKKTPLSDDEISSRLQAHIRDAMNYGSDENTNAREEAYDYYIGKPYGNERAGYSKVVTREVFETVEWAMPSVLRVFTSGDRIVSFDPRGPDDESEANQETDLTNHYIMDKADGFVQIHDWVKAGMLYSNSYMKVEMEDCERQDVREFTGLSRYGLQRVLTRFKDAEILEQRTYNIEPPQPDAPSPKKQKEAQAAQAAAAQAAQAQQGQDPQAAQAGPPQSPQPIPESEVDPFGDTTAFDIKIKIVTKEKKLRLQPLPGEQVLVEKGFAGHNLDDANFVCHRSKQSYTDLVSAGYDRELLDSVGAGEDDEGSDEEDNRLFYDEENDEAETREDALREFWVHECFVRIDADGDGLAERRRIVLIGKEVAENEEDDYVPIVNLSSIIIPHRHIGMSLAETVKDLQLISSTLRRQLLDNIYRLNIRKKYVGKRFLEDGGITIDALLDPTAELVPANDPTALIPEQVQPIVADLLPVIQDLDNTKQVRTGIAPNLSLDPEVLQQSTMGAFASALSEASQRIEMLVRILAETGFKHLMLKVHRLLRTNQDRAQAFKLRGEWVEVDPSEWLDRPNVKVNVGLGFHNKEQRVQMLFQLLQLQKEALQLGLSDPPKIYNLLDQLVEAAGLGNAQDYFVDPGKPGYQPPQPPPDPMAEAAQAQMQVEQGKLQKDMQKLQGDFQIEMQKLQGYLGEIQARIGQIEADTKLKEAQTAEVWARIGKLHKDDARQDRGEERADHKEAFNIAQGLRGARVEDDEREYNRYSEAENRQRQREIEDREFQRGLQEE